MLWLCHIKLLIFDISVLQNVFKIKKGSKQLLRFVNALLVDANLHAKEITKKKKNCITK